METAWKPLLTSLETNDALSMAVRPAPALPAPQGLHSVCKPVAWVPCLGTLPGYLVWVPCPSRGMALVPFFNYRQLLTSSREARTSALTSLDSSRSCARWPPVQAFLLTRCLPSGDLGPVDLAHGAHCLIRRCYEPASEAKSRRAFGSMSMAKTTKCSPASTWDK